MKKTLTICILGFNLMGGGIFAQQENVIPEVGRVGIGTLNPSSKLDVNGHVRIDSTLLIKDSLIIQKDARIMENLKIGGQLYLPNIEFSNGLIDKDFLVRDQNGQVLKSGIEELTQIIYSKQCPSNPLEDVPNPVWVNGLNKIYIDCPPVNVGIGTSTPRVKLDILGATHTNALSIGADPLNMVGKFHMKVTGLSPVNTSTVFLVENAQRRLFQINNDGIVRAREVVINLDNNWPDYVFHKDYRLKPLTELEQFISQNGHLPNVPSADVVNAEGVALGEMNRILLEKVEELTLYLIEQNKRIEELEKVLIKKTN
jgi:hypothetical protein